MRLSPGLERQAIEAGLFGAGAVVATNALERHIGRLQAAVLCGYPGSIAGTWQQIGRARTTEAALAVLVATGGVLDQYAAQHPEFIFDQSPEHARINSGQPHAAADQIRCAAFRAALRPGRSLRRAQRHGRAVLALLGRAGRCVGCGAVPGLERPRLPGAPGELAQRGQRDGRG
ncbi:MAG: hypothetical protein R2838_03315 [Caldilineaceae bacterium]